MNSNYSNKKRKLQNAQLRVIKFKSFPGGLFSFSLLIDINFNWEVNDIQVQ